RAGIVPLEVLKRDSLQRTRFLHYLATEGKLHLEPAFERSIEMFPLNEGYAGTRTHQASVRSVNSVFLDRYTTAVTLRQPTPHQPTAIATDAAYVDDTAALKEITWFLVVRPPAFATQQAGQQRVIERLLAVSMDAALGANRPAVEMFPLATAEQLAMATDL